MADRYVRPPLLAREPPPRWRAVWRFRLLGLVVIAVLLAGLFLAFQALSESTSQDPGLNSLGRAAHSLGRADPDLTAKDLLLR